MTSEKNDSETSDDWIRYKREKAVRFIEHGYSVEWTLAETNWISVYEPGNVFEDLSELRATAKFFMEPSRYGIENGRISKLHVREIRHTVSEELIGLPSGNVTTLYNYDRRHDVDRLAENSRAKNLADILVKELN